MKGESDKNSERERKKKAPTKKCYEVNFDGVPSATSTRHYLKTQ